MLVRHPLDKRDQDVKARVERLGIFAEPLDDKGVLLRHHDCRLDQDEDRDEQEPQRKHKRTVFTHDSLLC